MYTALIIDRRHKTSIRNPFGSFRKKKLGGRRSYDGDFMDEQMACLSYGGLETDDRDSNSLGRSMELATTQVSLQSSAGADTHQNHTFTQAIY